MTAQSVRITLGPSESFAIAQFARYIAPEEHAPRLTRHFLLDFAVVFLHHTNEAGGLVPDAAEEEIGVTEDEALNLMELVPVTATVGSAPIGLGLHRKLYEAMLRFHPEQATELRFTEIEDPSKEAVAVQLKKLKRRKGRNGRTRQ